jgi:hypothetical protein
MAPSPCARFNEDAGCSSIKAGAIGAALPTRITNLPDAAARASI